MCSLFWAKIRETSGVMLPVKVTVEMGSKKVAIEDVRDKRVAGPLRDAGAQVGKALATVVCPEHKKGPTHVRIHCEKSGNLDLKYDSCCEKLGALVEKALG